MPRIAVNGEYLHYQRRGEGPPLVLLHGLGTDGDLWTRQIAHWSKRFTCIAFDARGHGRSSANSAPTMSAVAADLLGALEQLGLLPAHLLGLSMGALQIALIHALAPGAVRSLIYCSCFAHAGPAEAERIAMIEARLATTPMAAFGETYAASTLQPATPYAARAALAKAIAGVPKEIYLATARSIFTADVSDELRAVRKPCLVVAGAHDDRTAPARCAEAARLVPGATLRQVADAGHLCNLDNPAGFHGAIDPFLDQVEAEARA